ncbi:RING finger and transmembrane domain-containing protein 2 [Phlebotomus papatasi]|uniref:RING finger and transmembrane domain-containing protein 2 n=1 Tax=Phlebotomus papatasi TaxID=29031 RepID=UPI0024840643|nr:RING finger and transmembrane domain-containing protein 2 [Phlebotomus papatasi]
MSGGQNFYFARGTTSQGVQAQETTIDLPNIESGSTPAEINHSPSVPDASTRRLANTFRLPNTIMTTNWRELTHMIHSSFLAQAQQSRTMNNFSTWIPTSGPTAVRSTGTTTHSSDSFVINVDGQAQGILPPPSPAIADNAPNPMASPPVYNHEAPDLRIPHHHHHSGPRITRDSGPETPVTEALSQMPEIRAFLQNLSRYMPYVGILLAKSCYDHIDGILDCFVLFVTFCHANWVVRQEVAKKQNKRILALVRVLIYIILAIVIVGFMLERKNIYISLMFASSFSEPFGLRNLLFSVGITDLVLKLITVAVKILITLLPASLLEYKGRGRVYLMTEAVSQLYRALAPIQPWLVFLLDSYTSYERIWGVILSATYMAAKGSDLLARAKFFKRSFIKLLQNVSFGVTPSKEQQQTAGGTCPICHDFYTNPVLLECNHIFCEACVGTWFDREQTCPLCRAKVVEDPQWKDGATTFFVQFY